MSKHIYKSAFLSIGGHRWDVRIEHDVNDGSDAETVEAEDFLFDVDAASVEWKDTAKHEPLQPSGCCITAISPADRTFAGLYTTGDSTALLTLSRDGRPFWRGLLDPEFYEEPYERLDNYEVRLTFSDFGSLGHVPFDIAPGRLVPYSELVASALGAACLSGSELAEDFELKRTQNGAKLALSSFSVCSDNFYDEEGEAMTWREVLESILQPLGLRMVQHDGSITVYDVHSLMAKTPLRIAWSAESQTLATGAVYNDLSVAYSPYAGGSGDAVCEMELDHDDLEFAGPEHTAHYKFGNHADSLPGFDLSYGEPKPEMADISDRRLACAYRIDAVYSGSDGAGIAGCITSNVIDSTTAYKVRLFGKVSWAGHRDSAGFYDNIGTLFAARPARICTTADTDCLLRVKLKMLLDSRYNPFESADKPNEEGNYERQQKYWNIVYVPVRIWIETDGGSKMRWVNVNLANSDSFDVKASSMANVWQAGTPAWGECWLAFYDWQERKDKSPCQGWMTNRPCFGRGYKQELPQMWEKRGDGEFISLPKNVHGTLHIEVGAGVDTVFLKRSILWDDTAMDGDKALGSSDLEYKMPRWLLYESLAADLVDTHGKDIDIDDIVYSATLIPSAREELEIETKCGSSEGTTPTAKGIIYLDGAPLGKLWRGDINGLPEQLLIASMASQYDSRHTVLSGEADASCSNPVAAYADAAQPEDTRFILSAATLSCREDVAEASYIELSPQKYTPAE